MNNLLVAAGHKQAKQDALVGRLKVGLPHPPPASGPVDTYGCLLCVPAMWTCMLFAADRDK